MNATGHIKCPQQDDEIEFMDLSKIWQFSFLILN